MGDGWVYLNLYIEWARGGAFRRRTSRWPPTRWPRKRRRPSGRSPTKTSSSFPISMQKPKPYNRTCPIPWASKLKNWLTSMTCKLRPVRALFLRQSKAWIWVCCWAWSGQVSNCRRRTRRGSFRSWRRRCTSWWASSISRSDLCLFHNPYHPIHTPHHLRINFKKGEKQGYGWWMVYDCSLAESRID